jgi:hypothetical protein
MRPPLRPPDEPDDDTPRDAAAAPVEPSTPAESAAPSDLLEILDPPAAAVDVVDNPFGLAPRELLFVEAYCGAAQFKAAKAYELAGYKTNGAAHRANASRLLGRERVGAAIAARMEEIRKRMRMMDGDEALEGISNMGRVDIRKCFPENSSIAKLPDDVADAVKAVTPTKFGYRIEMYDKLRARELMAKAAGKLKDVVKVEHTLEDILAAANRPDREAGQS